MIQKAGPGEVSFWGLSTQYMLKELEPAMKQATPLPEAEIDRLLPIAAEQLRSLARDPVLSGAGLTAMIHPLGGGLRSDRLPVELRTLQQEALRMFAIGSNEAGQALVQRIVSAAEALGPIGPSWDERKTIGRIPAGEEIPTIRTIAIHRKVPNDSEEMRATNRAFELDKMGKSEEALALYEEVRPDLEKAGNPTALRVLANRTGLALHHLGRDAEAREQCKKALEHDDRYAPAMYNLSAIELALGDVNAALSWLSRAIEQDERFFTELAKKDVDFIVLRSDPRFRELVGLPPLDAPVFSQAELEAAIDAMRAAWPKDLKSDVDPPAFVEKAEVLDAMKRAALDSLGERPKPEAVRRLLVQANQMHGKRGHTENVVSIASALFADEEFRAAIGKVDAAVVLAAAPWLNLADLEIPARYLAAPRRLTDAENERWIAPRAERSAALFEALALGDGKVARAIGEHRPKKGADRSREGMVLDLIDQIAALAAKPFFQKDGKVDVEKVLGTLSQNAAKAGIGADLVGAFALVLRSGLIDRAMSSARERDLYVR